MIHSLKTLDRDNLLPENQYIGNMPLDGVEEIIINHPYAQGYNASNQDHQALGVELNVEIIANILWQFSRKGKNPSSEQIKEFLPLAKVIANYPKILKLVKI